MFANLTIRIGSSSVPLHTLRRVWFSFGPTDLARELRGIRHYLGRILPTLNEVLDQIGAWGTSWRDRAITAEAAAEAEHTARLAAEAHAQAVVDNDATDDAVQLAAQKAADAAEASAAAQTKFDELKALDAPAEQPPAVDPSTEPPVVDEQADPPAAEPTEG